MSAHDDEAYQAFDLSIDIFLPLACVGNGIVRNIVNVVLAEEVDRDNPGARHDDLVDPSAVLEDVRSFQLIHYNLSFFLNGFFVSTHADDQIRVREKFLSLLKNLRVSYVIHIEDTISVNSDWVVGVRSIGL